MNFRRLAVIGNLLLAAVLMLAVWVLLVYVASRPALRKLIDLTPQSVNSVDVATEELLRELRAEKVKVEFHLFFPEVRGRAQTQAQQQEMTIRQRLQDLTKMLVRRYQWLGGESVEIHTHDLRNDLDATREAAQAFEYKGPYSEVVVTVQRPGRERRFRKLSLIADLAEIRVPDGGQPGAITRAPVPVLQRYLGEVQLSSAIKSLLVQGTPVIYFLTGFSKGTVRYQDESIGAGYGGLFTALTSLGFECRTFNMSRQKVIPRDASMVVVLEPRDEFPDLEAEALFSYLQRGGRLFINYSYAPGNRDWNPTGGKLGELLGYEIGLLPVYHLIPDPSGRTGSRGLDGNPAVAKLQLGLNPEHPVTRRLAQEGRPMEVGGARALKPQPSPPDGITIQQLMATGKNAWLARPGPDGRPDLRAPQVGLQPYLVGAAIEVAPLEAAKDAPEDPPEDPPEDDPPTKGRVVLVTGAFCNNAGIQLFGDLAFNICNWLSERRVLLNIQSNRYQPRQMKLVPQQTDRVHTMLVQVAPSIFLLAGVIVFFVRRRL